MPGWVPRTATPRRAEQQQSGPSLIAPANFQLVFDGLGTDAILTRLESNAAAWITLYDSEAAFTADATRPLESDPSPSSGVVAEARFTQPGGGVLHLPPGVTFSSPTSPPARAIWARVRLEQSGALTPLLTLAATVLID